MFLDVRDLTITLKTGEEIAKDISFSIDGGEMLSIVGSSGAGKTTVCKAVMGLLSSNYSISGEVLYRGENLLHCSKKRLQAIYGKETVSYTHLDVYKRQEDEMKEYAQRVKQLSADEIYRHSAETAAKESLLSALIHDSYELDDDDLDLILKPKNPVEALYQFLTSDKTDLSSESSISSILSEYNAQCQERDLTLGEEVTMC